MIARLYAAFRVHPPLPAGDRRRRNMHRNKIIHPSPLGAYRQLAAMYWHYWRNSRFRTLPTLGFRTVYRCDWNHDGTIHYHIGRTR